MRRRKFSEISYYLIEGSKGYRFLEHTTDAQIEAYGSTLEESFENAGKALEDTMVDIKTIVPNIHDHINVEGTDKEDLLYEWLESLIAKQDIDGMLYSKFRCKIQKKEKKGFELDALVSGEKFNLEKHEQKTAIKAPTFHGMKIEENVNRRQITLKFLLDL